MTARTANNQSVEAMTLIFLKRLALSLETMSAGADVVPCAYYVRDAIAEQFDDASTLAIRPIVLRHAAKESLGL